MLIMLFKIRLMMVVSSTNSTTLSMLGFAVMGVQREQERAEHTALGGSSVQH